MSELRFKLNPPGAGGCLPSARRARMSALGVARRACTDVKGERRMVMRSLWGVLLGCALFAASAAAAKDLLNAQASMADNLRALQAAKQQVTVVLKGGEESYKATIGAVGEDYVLLTQLSGKEFFDALVAIDEIAAVEVRARDR